MNKGKLTIVFILLSLLALSWGCSGSGNGGSGVLPEAQPPAQEMRDVSGHWGTYQVSIDLNTHEVDITQLRQADLILNVLGFMEPPALDTLSIDFDSLVIDPDNNYIGVDVVLTHPIPDPTFMGFDVRGICIGPELTNADGYTILMNPADFEGVPFGYMDGLLGAPNSYAGYDGVWGYKYFCGGLGTEDDLATFFYDEDNLTNRGVFSESTSNWRHYDLSWDAADVEFLVFNYAVYANYDWPDGDPPHEIDNFFISTANSQEPFCATGLDPVANTLYYDLDDDEGGGMVTLDVEVWDWQDASIQIVTIESVEAGVIAQTSSDADAAGSTSKSWLYTFTDVPGIPTTSADLDILITITSPDVTFGEGWFFDLLDPSHIYYDDNLWCTFITSVPVSDEGPAGEGFSIKISDDLPATLPTSNEKNLCVVGDDAFGKGGVYYHGGTTGNYQVHKYPLDYSAPSVNFCTMVNPWGPMDSWFGSPAEMGSVEVSPMGAFIVNTRSAGPDPFWSGPRRRCHHLYGTTCNAVNVWLVYNMQATDLFSTSDSQATVYSWAKGDPTSVAPGYTYKHDPPYEGGSDWMPGYYPPGAGDGLVSEDHTRGGMDSAPNFSGYDCMVAYVEGTSAANSAVEVYKNFKTIPSPSSVWTLKSTNGLVGRAKDVSWLANYGVEGFEDAVGNYMCVLEDNEDTTWQVSVWEWDNDNSALLLVARYSPAISGTPYNLDCDTENQEIHVWADDGGTPTYYVFWWG